MFICISAAGSCTRQSAEQLKTHTEIQNISSNGDTLTQNQCQQFDGIDDYAAVDDNPALDLTNSLTLEAWINFEAGGTDNPRIISKGWEVRTGYEFALYGTGIERRLAFLAKNLGRTFSDSLLAANRWYHVAATYNGSEVKLYINGLEDQLRRVKGTIATNDISLNIGQNSQNFTDRYKGRIAEIRIWNIARPGDVIRRDMQRMLTGKEEGLVGCWLFGRDTSENISDISPIGNIARMVTTGGTPVNIAEKPSTRQKTEIAVNKTYTEKFTGKVLDAMGEPVSGAVVILCDQKTGVPVNNETYRPFTDEFLKGNQMMDIAYVISDEQGRFIFENISAGEYRIVAQSWRDVEQFKGVFEKNGKEIELHGIAEHIQVSPEKSPEVLLRPLGTGTLQVNEDAPNDETLLVVSISPTRADPILGFTGWGGAFMQNMIGGNRMPKGKTTVYGLPEGRVYLAMFAADSVPGWTEGQAEIKPDTTTVLEYIPFVNSWSNSRHDPPEHLVPVFEEVKQMTSQNSTFFLNIYKDLGLDIETSNGIWGLMAQLGPHLDKEITLPSGLKTTFGEMTAAGYYIQLQQTVERRQARIKRDAEMAQMETSTSQTGEKVGYEEAFLDLYREIGRQYPCFELKDIDWKAVGEEFLPRAGQVQNNEDFGLLCMELVARLEDSHAYMLAGTAKLPEISFPRWDPGFACMEDDQSRAAVYYVDKNSPAERAGIKIGMVVNNINAQEAHEAIDETMLQLSKYSGYSSRRYLRYHAYHFFVRQENRGAAVKLKMLDSEGKLHDFELPANLGVRYLPRLPVPKSGINDSGEVSWKMLEDDIGYIYVRRIGNNLITLLDKAVEELKNAHGMIIDVRGNSGGGFDSNRSHLNFALDRDSQEPERPRYKGPMAVLIDSRCISAGEGWASWFIANKRARLFGRATAGASARKIAYELKNGLFKVQIPVKAYTGYLNRPIERLGLIPDVPVSQSAEDLIQGRDTVLENARQYLLNRVE